MKNRLLPIFICLIMLLSVFSAFEITAADDDKWVYEFTLKVRNKSGAEASGSSVYGFIEFYGQGIDDELSFQIKGSGEIKRGSTVVVKRTSNYAPWIVDWVGIRNNCDDALCVEYISARVAINQKNPSNWVTILDRYNPKSDNEKWIETQKGSGYDTQFKKSINIKRDLKSVGNFNNFAGETMLYVGSDYSSSVISKRWDGNVSDQYNNLIGSYNCLNYTDAPTMSFSASAKTLDSDKELRWDTLKAGGRFSETIVSGKTVGFDIYPDKLLSYMNDNSINQITIVTKLKFSTRGINRYYETFKYMGGNYNGEITKTYTIKRNTFAISEVTYYNTTKTLDNSNHYYGETAGSVKLQLQIKTGGNNMHLTNRMLYGNTVRFSDIIIQVGGESPTGEKTYIKASKKSAMIDSSGRFSLTVPIPSDCDSKDVGITLILKGGTVTINNVTYRLCEERSGFIPGEYSEYRVGNKYKIDTVIPSVSVTSENEAIDGWRKTYKFTAVPSENIFITGEDNAMNVEFVQKVTSKGTSVSPYEIKKIYPNGSISQSSLIHSVAGAAGNGTDIELCLRKNIEAVGSVYISGYDIAGNPLQHIIKDIKLDNLAPRINLYTYNKERAIDGSKSVEFSFKLTDASGTGKVYYSFVNGNDSAPPITSLSGQNTGTLETTLGKWAFIEQSNNNFDGTALIKCTLGRNFNGRLYYYTEDALGNRSSIYERNINITNENTDCDITAIGSDTSLPQKNYNIAITSLESNTIYWRWRNSINGGIITDYALYTSGAETGSGTQPGSDGNAILLNGLLTLEVKIVTPSGRYATEKRNFNFDNNNPTVMINISEENKFASTHTVTVKADDLSGITEAYADILFADGSPVPELETIDLLISGGTVNNDIFVNGLESGAYKVRAVATDANGFVTEKNSAVFYIRNGKPQLSLEINAPDKYEDVPILSGGTYVLNIKASEIFKSVRAEAPNQYLYYRVSVNANYGELFFGGLMIPTSDGYKLVYNAESTTDGINITLPSVFTEGSNTIYVQAIIISSDSDIESADMRTLSSAEIKVFYDDTAPLYTLELNDTHTSGNATGTITAYDNFSSNITAISNTVSITDITGENGENIKKYNIEISENGTHTVLLTDAAGNTSTVNITVSNIDRTAPNQKSITPPTAVISGARTDYFASIAISGHDSERVKFGFIMSMDLASAYETDGVTIKPEYFNYGYDSSRFAVAHISEKRGEYDGESDSVYTIKLSAVEGDYYLAVYCEDSVGNGSYKIYDDAMLMPRDASPEILSYSVSPKKAGTRAILTADFNVPVKILPLDKIRTVADMSENEKLEADAAGISYEEWIKESNFAAIDKYINVFSQTYSAKITSAGTYSFYIMDETGRTELSEITLTDNNVTFGNDPGITAKTYNCFSNHPNGETVMTEITDGNYASAYQWYNNEGNVVSSKVTVTAEPGKYLFPVLFTNIDSSEVIDIDGLHFMDDDGIGTNEDSEWVELKDKDGFTIKAYTKLVYNVFAIKDDNGNAVDRNERTLKVQYFSPPDGISWDQVVFEDVELVIDNIDNTPAVTSVHTSPSIEQDINGKPLYYTLGNITADITVSDPHTGISKIYFYTYKEGNNNFIFEYEFTEQLRDNNGNPLFDNDGKPLKYLDAETFKKFEASNEYMYIAVYDIPGDENTKRIEMVFYKNVPYAQKHITYIMCRK